MKLPLAVAPVTTLATLEQIARVHSVAAINVSQNGDKPVRVAVLERTRRDWVTKTGDTLEQAVSQVAKELLK